MQLRLADVPGLELAVSSIESVGTRILKKQVVKGERGRISEKTIKTFAEEKLLKDFTLLMD